MSFRGKIQIPNLILSNLQIHIVHVHVWTIITSPPIGGGRGIVMPMSVCLFVCVGVCPCVFVRVFAKFQSVISQSFLNRSS